jgi:hypothetical protein
MYLWLVFDCHWRRPRSLFSAPWQASAGELAQRGKKRNFGLLIDRLLLALLSSGNDQAAELILWEQ